MIRAVGRGPGRLNGRHKRCRFLTDELTPYVDWASFWPEAGTGLRMPREAIRLAPAGCGTPSEWVQSSGKVLMAGGFLAVRRNGPATATPVRAEEPPADAQAIRSPARPLCPSRVAAPGTSGAVTGSPSPGARLGGVRRAPRLLRPSQLPVPAGQVPPTVREVLRSPGTPLDAGTREFMEERLGADFSSVRVHDDSTARTGAVELGARAYTVGEHVVVSGGGADKRTIAHELTHVVQQRQGLGTDAPFEVSGPHDAHERAAEITASRVVDPRAAVPAVPATRQGAGGGILVQRVIIGGLPEGEFRKRDVTAEQRHQIGESAQAFATQQEELEANEVYQLLLSLGFTLDKVRQFITTARTAKDLPSSLEGRFSGTKRQNLVTGHQQVRQAEAEDLYGQARREIETIYPFTDVIPEGRNLRETLTDILTMAREEDTYASYRLLKYYIDKASVTERRAAGQDARLLDLLLERVAGRTDFPKVAIDLRVLDRGDVAHYTPEAADTIIRNVLREWIPNVVIGNQSITGKAAVLRGGAWEATLRSYLAGKVPESTISDTIEQANAFTAPDGFVFISGDRGNAGTMIHEGIHFYAPDDFLRKYGEPLNEGVTEYLARKITRPLGIQRTQYKEEFIKAKQFIGAAGEQAVIDAYFKGGDYLRALDNIQVPVKSPTALEAID